MTSTLSWSLTPRASEENIGHRLSQVSQQQNLRHMEALLLREWWRTPQSTAIHKLISFMPHVRGCYSLTYTLLICYGQRSLSATLYLARTSSQIIGALSLRVSINADVAVAQLNSYIYIYNYSCMCCCPYNLARNPFPYVTWPPLVAFTDWHQRHIE